MDVISDARPLVRALGLVPHDVAIEGFSFILFGLYLIRSPDRHRIMGGDQRAASPLYKAQNLAVCEMEPVL